mmetsp:Transcript_27048/g.76394  ORF Transcript_27048/g.76394 Transcript_27048/m.76394 type:complete len:550 (+) Transcript_27048:74-1723(+)
MSAGAGGDDEKSRQSLVDSTQFAAVMGFIVIVNVLTIGLETDQRGSMAGLFGVINNSFLLIYFAELCLRLLTHGLKALQDKLTVVDILLVVCAFVERVVSERSIARALPCFRMFRLFRLARSFKYIRSNRELRLLLAGAFKALMTLFWVTLLLFFVLWAGATCAHRTIGESAHWVGSMDPMVDHEPFTSFDNHEYFGSVSRSYITLMQVMTLSQWANHIARPVMKAFPVIFLFFAFFLLATTYGLLNCIISNIVQDSLVQSQGVEKAKQEVEREDRKRLGARAYRVLNMVDKNGDGELSPEEIDNALSNTNLGTVFRDLDVPFEDASSIVNLFDKNGNGYVSYDELVDGLVAMGDDILPRDYTKLAIWVWNLLMITQSLEQRIVSLCKNIEDLKRNLQVAFSAIEYHMNTKDLTELRRRALHLARTAPAPVAPLPVQVEDFSAQNALMAEEEARQYRLFARRLFGEGKKSLAPTATAALSLRDAAKAGLEEGKSIATVVCGKAVLPPAPPPLGVAQEDDRRNNPPTVDKYTVQGIQQSPSLKNLRELLR